MNRKPLVSAIRLALAGSAEVLHYFGYVDEMKRGFIYPYYRLHVQVTESYELKQVIEFREYLVEHLDSLIQTTQMK